MNIEMKRLNINKNKKKIKNYLYTNLFELKVKNNFLKTGLKKKEFKIESSVYFN